MKLHSFAVAALAAMTMNANAQVPCHELESAIDNALKAAAMATATVARDDHLGRHTNRLLEANNQLQVINGNVILLTLHKCPMVRKTPLNPAVYSSEAVKCKLAEVNGNGGAPICDMQTWKGLGK